MAQHSMAHLTAQMLLAAIPGELLLDSIPGPPGPHGRFGRMLETPSHEPRTTGRRLEIMGEKQPLGLQGCPEAMRTKLQVWGVKRPAPKAESQSSQKDTTKRSHETSPKQLKWSRERSAAHHLPSSASLGKGLHNALGPCCTTAPVPVPFRMVSNASSTLVESSAEVSTNSSPLLSARRGAS